MKYVCNKKIGNARSFPYFFKILFDVNERIGNLECLMKKTFLEFLNKHAFIIFIFFTRKQVRISEFNPRLLSFQANLIEVRNLHTELKKKDGEIDGLRSANEAEKETIAILTATISEKEEANEELKGEVKKLSLEVRPS